MAGGEDGEDTMSDKPNTILESFPMAGWAGVTETMDIDARYTEERRAAEAAVYYARLSAYLSRRMSGGKHADAVKRQNQVAAKVRQALGYTYKEAPIEF
jgi:hypothetical protein